MSDLKLQCRVLSSLEKVFCSAKLKTETGPVSVIDAARGETAAFQLALNCAENIFLEFSAGNGWADRVTFREVCHVPCEMPGRRDPDDDFVLKTEPGLYPDPLKPLEKPLRLYPGLWQSVWVSVTVQADMKPGTYTIPVTCRRIQYMDNPWEVPVPLEIHRNVKIHVHEAVLPPQKLICTNWFYADTLTQYYHVKAWSEQFWTILETYFRDYAAHGCNMLLTPLWSVPLDTKIGGERPTVQLLDIECRGGRYFFDFARLKRWIDLAKACGLEYFEMSHFFTQWGAHAAPKIVVREGGKYVKKFGWHTPSNGAEYRDFLEQLLPFLLDFLRGEKLQNKCYFHFSDEPEEKVIESYREATKPLRKYLKDDEFPVIDALGSVRYFREGLVKRPVPSLHRLASFKDEAIPHRWCYFATAFPGYPSRYYNAPLCRCRILGVLLYLYNMEGFLHWGHNFWFAQYSREWDLDPWYETTSGRGFSGGSSTNVYPAADGTPCDSLHYESFMEAMQDLRLLQLAESRLGRDTVEKLICKDLDYRPEMNHFPHQAEWLLNMRKRIFAALDA